MAVKKGVFTVPGDGDIEMRPLAEVVHNDITVQISTYWKYRF